MRVRGIVGVGAALIAIAAGVPATAGAATQGQRIAKLEKQVRELQRNYGILSGRSQSLLGLAGVLYKEYQCTPYLLAVPATLNAQSTTLLLSPFVDWGTNTGFLIPTRVFGTLTFGSGGSVNCDPASSASSAALRRTAVLNAAEQVLSGTYQKPMFNGTIR